jgi:hypothetical protein
MCGKPQTTAQSLPVLMKARAGSGFLFDRVIDAFGYAT